MQLLAGVGGVKAGSFHSIATTNITTNTASVTFSSIPATFKHLQIRFIARTNQTGDVTGSYLTWTFNSDTAANYVWHVTKGDGSIVNSAAIVDSAVTYSERITSSFQSSNVFGAGCIDILDYANTNKFKTHRTLAAWDSNGSGQIAFNSGLWRSTSAINQITIYPAANDFVQYSSFALYGIKG